MKTQKLAVHSSLDELLGGEYFANDGVVPIFSQWHPGNCSPSRCKHCSTLNSPSASPPIELSDQQLTGEHADLDQPLELVPEPGIFRVHHISGVTC